ncbi:MAG TPA: hypothetical protein DDZ81_12900 [Acetobacteraceae bacterium]|nr:hypothetical protein [Acetobacteraceae bacterium]
MDPEEVNPVLQILGMTGEQIPRCRVQVQRHRRPLFADRIEDGAADMARIQQGLDIRIHRLLALDRLRMDPAEDQQMMVLGQIVQCAQGSFEAFVARKEPKRANQLRVGRQGPQNWKLVPRSCLAYALRLFGGDIAQRMVIDVPDTEHVAQQACIAFCMDDYIDWVGLLPGMQQPVGTGAEFTAAPESLHYLYRSVYLACQQAPADRRPVQGLVAQYRMECDRHRRRGVYQPAQTPVNLMLGPPKRAVLKLNIHAVEFMQVRRDVLDVQVRQTLHPGVRAAQQILVQVEDCHFGVRT